MARIRFRRDLCLAPLLALWFATVAAAAPSSFEAAHHKAREAIERGNYLLADRIVEEALKRNPPSNDRWYWELRVLRGKTLNLNKSFDVALKWLAFELPPALRESPLQVLKAVHLGIAHYGNGDAKRAAALLADARKASERYPDAGAEAFFWSTYLDSNPDYPRRALELARKTGDRYVEINALNGLGFSAGKRAAYGEAIYWFEQMQAAAEAKHRDYFTQRALGNLGWTYAELGDYETAAQYFEQAAPMARRGNSLSDLVIWTNQRGNMAMQMGNYAEAEKYCAEAVSIAAGRTKEEALGHALANLARIAIETRRPGVAEIYNKQALAVKKDPDSVERSHILDAEIASLRNQHDAAIAQLRKIARSKTRAVQWEARGRLAQVLLLVGRNKEAEIEFQSAITTVQEARASVPEKDLRFAFYRVAEEVFDAYVDFLVAQNRNEEALAVTERIRAATLEEALGLHAPKGLDPKALARERQATILCYWLGRHRSYLWAVTPGDIKLHVLPPDRAIESEIDDYQRDILDTRLTISNTRSQAQKLFKMLVAPARTARRTRVIVIPDGRLHALNMESLVVPGSKRFWIEDVTLVNASSLQLLESKPRSLGHAGRMLLIGNPRKADDAYLPLGQAQQEIEDVRRHFDQSTVLQDANATPLAYSNAKPGTFDYIHFVAHGEATQRKPLDSAVILARDKTGSYKLLASEIVKQRLNARLVTISSCYGAGKRTFVGEGLVGLSWAFLNAGARQVIGALWEVNDVTTPPLMDEMYAGIRAGKDPATALREAKLTLVHKEAQPFYWAPFVLYGGM